MTSNVSNPAPSLLAWIDIETTGLRGPDEETLLEVGIAVTDQWGHIIDANDWLTVFRRVPVKSESLVREVRIMHQENGLLDEYNEAVARKNFVRPQEVEQEMIDWLTPFFRDGEEKWPMCGSNVANFDRPYIKRYFPRLDNTLHYRNIDISTIRELCRRHNFRVWENAPKPVKAHRAIPDLDDSIKEYQHYLDNFLFTTGEAEDENYSNK